MKKEEQKIYLTGINFIENEDKLESQNKSIYKLNKSKN